MVNQYKRSLRGIPDIDCPFTLTIPSGRDPFALGESLARSKAPMARVNALTHYPNLALGLGRPFVSAQKMDRGKKNISI